MLQEIKPKKKKKVAMPKKQTKKSAMKKFLVSYDVFAIFTSVEHMELSLEAKNKSLLCLHYKLFNYLCYICVLCYAIK